MEKVVYFKLEEFLASETAKKKGYSNFPSFQHVENLNKIASRILDPVRVKLGEPVYITSGFRSMVVNKLVGGVPFSAHTYGRAVDIKGKDRESTRKIFNILRNEHIHFIDQLIEYNDFKFIHVGFGHHEDNPDLISFIRTRHQVLHKTK